MIYDRRFGLPQSMVNYLNQPLPNISGIFSSPNTSGILSLPEAQFEPIDNEEIESLTTIGLTPEQLALLYPQPQMGGGEGGYQDEDTTIGDGSTLGIDSFGDVIDFGKKNIGTIAAASLFGPVNTLIGKGISSFFGSPTLSEFKKAKTFQEFFENQKAQKAAAIAKAREEAIAIEQANREAVKEEAAAKAAAAEKAAANRDRAKDPTAAAAAKAAATRDKAKTRTGRGNNTGGGNVGGTGSQAAADTSQGETGYGSCFIAGTKVTMADGTVKNIEDIKVGDKVKGHKGNNEVIKLDPTLLANRKLYSFNDNEHYFFTSEHPFMTEEGWKSIKPEKTKERDGIELYNQLKGELKIGDKLVTEKGLIEIKEIKSKEMNDPKMPLYNFNVSNDNSYIADGYVVHNKGGGGGSSGSSGGPGASSSGVGGGASW